MMRGHRLVTPCLLVLCLIAVTARAELEDLGYYVQGGTLAGSPAYSWWYGCSPTSAGMMMGYYDAKGYSNLVPGGVAEASTFPSTAGTWQYLAQNTIASSGHVTAFYSNGYLGSGDDLARPTSSFNCLADFMGTSQDSVGNVNGSTSFYYYTNGAPLHDYQALAGGFWNQDGMYGIGEYINYAGYEVADLYTQLISNNPAHGFTFSQYKNEIDAGRVVLIHVENHTMLGYGYNDSGSQHEVILNDTWTLGLNTMTWGGSYSGLTMWGVTVLELSPVPLPAAVLLGILGLSVAGVKLRRFV